MNLLFTCKNFLIIFNFTNKITYIRIKMFRKKGGDDNIANTNLFSSEDESDTNVSFQSSFDS